MYLSKLNIEDDIVKINSEQSSPNIISTINAHSYNLMIEDRSFRKALINSSFVIPDGISIVFYFRIFKKKIIKKISGYQIFIIQLNNISNKSLFFLGSTMDNLKKIKSKIKNDFPLKDVHIYSPPFEKEFSPDENLKIINYINSKNPDILFVGMTAPKQEKWVYNNYKKLNVKKIICIGAVFDFYSGNKKRAPSILINFGLEWLHRLLSEPTRLAKRYLIGNLKFIYNIIKYERT